MKKRKINPANCFVAFAVTVITGILLAAIYQGVTGNYYARAAEVYKYEYSFGNENSIGVVQTIRANENADTFNCSDEDYVSMRNAINEVLHKYGQNYDYQLGENSYSYAWGKLTITNKDLRVALVKAVQDGDKYQKKYNVLVKEIAAENSASSLINSLSEKYTLDEKATLRTLMDKERSNAKDMAKLISDVCSEMGVKSKYNANGVWIDNGSYIQMDEVFNTK